MTPSFFSVFIPNDEALTSYFDYVIQIGFQRLRAVEIELEKARSGQKCDLTKVNKNLIRFVSELSNFPNTGNNNEFFLSFLMPSI
jgi:hypothetical protein